MQEDLWFGWVFVDMEEAEVGVFQLLEQAEPIAHHGRVITTHLKTRPVEVKLQEQLTNWVQNSLQDQILQNFPLCTLHVCLQYIHLKQEKGMLGMFFFSRS